MIRPFNLHLHFWKSRSWKIKVCFKPQKNFSSCTPEFYFSRLDFFSVCQLDFFQICTINLKKIQVTNWKKIRCTEKQFRCTGTEIFIRFETDLDVSKRWFSEIKVQNRWLNVILNPSAEFSTTGTTIPNSCGIIVALTFGYNSELFWWNSSVYWRSALPFKLHTC